MYACSGSRIIDSSDLSRSPTTQQNTHNEATSTRRTLAVLAEYDTAHPIVCRTVQIREAFDGPLREGARKRPLRFVSEECEHRPYVISGP